MQGMPLPVGRKGFHCRISTFDLSEVLQEWLTQNCATLLKDFLDLESFPVDK